MSDLIKAIEGTNNEFPNEDELNNDNDDIGGVNSVDDGKTQSSSKQLNFAHSLKGWNDTNSMIVSINHELFHNTGTKKESPTHDSSINVDVVTGELLSSRAMYGLIERCYFSQ